MITLLNAESLKNKEHKLIDLKTVNKAGLGHETGNGGDSHLSRYLLAKHVAEVTLKKVSKSKLQAIFWDATEKHLSKIVEKLDLTCIQTKENRNIPTLEFLKVCGDTL